MKKKVLLVFIALLLLLIKTEVNAECTSDELQALKTEAQLIRVTLNLNKLDGSENGKIYDYCYDLTLYDLNDNFYSDFGRGENTNKDNVQFIPEAFCSPGENVIVEIYASQKTKCPNTSVRKIYLSLPYYNKYSDRKECENLKKYDICKEDANTENITEENFINLINEYEQKEKEKHEVDVKEESNVEKVIRFVKENSSYIIISVVSFLIVLTIIILIIKKKNKNKIRIDFGD